MSFQKTCLILFISILLASCAPDQSPIVFPTYDPFLPVNGGTASVNEAGNNPSTAIPQFTPTRRPTPTRVPLNISPLIGKNQVVDSPTPDTGRILPTPRQSADEYIVQPGDTLGIIAQKYGISVQMLLNANNITDPNLLEVGTTLTIPAPQPTGSGMALKIIPDSELVNGPATVYFNTDDFIASQNGYLESYTQDVNGETLTGAEIVDLVSTNYSVNPRILLALLEYESRWVTNPAPVNVDYPMGNIDENRAGLYRQLSWAANTLNRGYYLWRANAVSTWILSDGQVLPIDPTINAGTAALQYLFSQLDGYDAWQTDTGQGGVVVTYFVFFGNPFSYSIEPLVPANLSQPRMTLPFSIGESWYFTGGPHGGWDSGSAWAALDFAPPDNTGDCSPAASWVTAVTDGLIVRAKDGAVIQDLDNDGYEQTGWVVLYMHVSSEGRVQPNEYLFTNEHVGHPSCEGGVANAAHLHIARKYNGEWISADGSLPFNLDGWVSSGDGIEYDGFLKRDSKNIEAIDGANEENLVTH